MQRPSLRPIDQQVITQVPMLPTPMIKPERATMQIGRQQCTEVPHSRDGTLYEAGESGRVHGRSDQNKADRELARQTNVPPHAVVNGD